MEIQPWIIIYHVTVEVFCIVLVRKLLQNINMWNPFDFKQHVKNKIKVPQDPEPYKNITKTYHFKCLLLLMIETTFEWSLVTRCRWELIKNFHWTYTLNVSCMGDLWGKGCLSSGRGGLLVPPSCCPSPVGVVSSCKYLLNGHQNALN